ncbi:CARDB domain-containing protein [Thiobacillus denitrificans]|uniref:CARDB domain-containing protein n=1 Tax=Thiobacillus denitrificans TaxID=36861 RepID=UPI000372A35C|nr:CARDB domain-containing protein [Thiobacillus denitrificans]
MLRFFAVILAVFIASAAVQAAAPNETADLSVTLTDSPDPVRQGEPLTYRLTVSNHGPGTARNARVVLSPVYGKLLSPLDVACRVVDINIECALSELAPGASTSYQWTVPAQGVRQTSVMSGVSSDADSNDYNNARGQVTRVLYRVRTPEERIQLPPKPKLGERSCFITHYPDGTNKGENLKPALTPMEIGGVQIVALPQGFQDLMPGSAGPLYLGVLLTAIDQPNFPDWIKLKRAVFTQAEVQGITQGETQLELLLGENQEDCGNVLRAYFFQPHGVERNEKLLCANSEQVRLHSSRPTAMHLWIEDNQGEIHEIKDVFCPATAM